MVLILAVRPGQDGGEAGFAYGPSVSGLKLRIPEVRNYWSRGLEY